MINDGTKSYDHQHDGSTQIQGSCIRDFRNKPLPVRLKIQYINQVLTVRNLIKDNYYYFFLILKIYINNGISQDDNAFEMCTRIERIQLPRNGYLGVTAATGGLADDHDVLEFLTYSYSDRQVSVQNQAATDEQAKKYKEEYEKYEQELKKQQAEFVFYLILLILLIYSYLISYQREHPELTTPINEQQLV
jgi:mannose-binding lectin 1